MQGIVPQGEQNSGIELTNAFARRKFARRQEKRTIRIKHIGIQCI